MAARGIWRNPVLTLNGISYTGEATEATLVPDVTIQTQKTLNPAVVLQDVDTPTWTFTLNGVQGGLSDCLTDMAAGTEVDVVMQAAQGAGARTATFTVLALPTDFGGEQGNYATFSLSLPVLDQPVFDVSS
jgi:hypothetical protein